MAEWIPKKNEEKKKKIRKRDGPLPHRSLGAPLSSRLHWVGSPYAHGGLPKRRR